MRVCKIILISLVVSVIMFFVSINFIFTIPFGKGRLLVWGVGVVVAVISGLISIIILEKKFPKTYKKELEQKLNELKAMNHNGLITKEEYENKRKELVDKF